MGFNDKHREEEAEIDLARLERNRTKNRLYYDDFIKMHQETLANGKLWRDDEISVNWSGTFVTLVLHGWDSTSMIVETGSDWPKFKTDLEMGYENMLMLRFKAHQKLRDDKDKQKYNQRKRALYQSAAEQIKREEDSQPKVA